MKQSLAGSVLDSRRRFDQSEYPKSGPKFSFCQLTDMTDILEPKAIDIDTLKISLSKKEIFNRIDELNSSLTRIGSLMALTKSLNKEVEKGSKSIKQAREIMKKELPLKTTFLAELKLFAICTFH